MCLSEPQKRNGRIYYCKARLTNTHRQGLTYLTITCLTYVSTAKKGVTLIGLPAGPLPMLRFSSSGGSGFCFLSIKCGAWLLLTKKEKRRKKERKKDFEETLAILRPEPNPSRRKLCTQIYLLIINNISLLLKYIKTKD